MRLYKNLSNVDRYRLHCTLLKSALNAVFTSGSKRRNKLIAECIDNVLIFENVKATTEEKHILRMIILKTAQIE